MILSRVPPACFVLLMAVLAWAGPSSVAAQESSSAAPAAAAASSSTSSTGDAAAPQPAPEPPPQKPGLWSRTKEGVGFVWSGSHDVYMPTYAVHLPWKYNEGWRNKFNEWTLGFGYGRTNVDSKGNEHSLYAVGSSDSYEELQLMAGYSWRHFWRPGGGALKLGAGYTALVISRKDYYSRTPLPLALPLGSIGIEHVDLMGAYVPYHEILFLMFRVKMP